MPFQRVGLPAPVAQRPPNHPLNLWGLLGSLSQDSLILCIWQTLETFL